MGQDGNDLLAGGIDNDWLQGGGGRNDRLGKDDLSGNGGDDCLILGGAENERAGGGDGDDIIFADVRNGGDDIFCGAGIDTVEAHLKDRVAANCENVLRLSRPGATGATPEAEVTISTPEGTITMTPQEIGS